MLNTEEVQELLRVCRKYAVSSISVDGITVTFESSKPTPYPEPTDTKPPVEVTDEDLLFNPYAGI